MTPGQTAPRRCLASGLETLVRGVRTTSEPVRIATGAVVLNGEIGVPLGPRGVVVFPRIGTSRIDACSHRVRQELQQVGFATVVVDLLLRGRESSGARARSERAGPELLGNRLAIVTDWARRNPAIRLLPIGCFGATSAMASSKAPLSRGNAGAVVINVTRAQGFSDRRFGRLPTASADRPAQTVYRR
jgi:putative phosphoribosyl transferase